MRLRPHEAIARPDTIPSSGIGRGEGTICTMYKEEQQSSVTDTWLNSERYWLRVLHDVREVV